MKRALLNSLSRKSNSSRIFTFLQSIQQKRKLKRLPCAPAHKYDTSEERVRKAVQKFAKLKSTATQGRLDSFFTVIPKEGSSSSGVKRKVWSL